MNTILRMIGLVLFVALYALAWHDQPARDNVPMRKRESETRDS